MFRCCGFIKHPEIEIVNINDEYYVNNDNFQERIKDLKYFNRYCYSKSRFLLFFLLVDYIGFSCNLQPFALGLIGFSLSVERKVVVLSSIVYGIFYILFGLLLFSPPRILLRYVFVDSLVDVIVWYSSMWIINIKCYCSYILAFVDSGGCSFLDIILYNISCFICVFICMN